MGKTADGAIWLDEKKLSNFDFFQFGETLTMKMYLNFYIFLLNFQFLARKIINFKG